MWKGREREYFKITWFFSIGNYVDEGTFTVLGGRGRWQ